MGQSTEFAGKISCSSLRHVVSRWLSRLRQSRVKRVAGESAKLGEDKVLSDEQKVNASCSTKCLDEGNMRDSSALDTGRSVNSSFNLGVGCCLLYLLAASKNELHKMIEMRMQMEALLVRSREEFLKKDEHSDLAELNNIFDYSATNELLESPSLPKSSTVTVCDQSCKCETPEREECSEEEEEEEEEGEEGMDRLEAELEAELELLQRHLDTDELWKAQEEQIQRIKVSGEHTASSNSQTLSHGEVIDPLYQEADSDCGVPPKELERRLHELLEERQQEQIRELQSALECLKHKLHEKELEVAWWRDTAKVVSQHATDLSSFASKLD